MDLTKIIITTLLVLKCGIQVDSFVDPLSLTIYGAIGVGITYLLKNEQTRSETYKYVHKAIDKACQMIGYCEGCEEYWIYPNLQGLEVDLKSGVFGQSLAVEITLNALKGHLNKRNPTKSLVLSFQGSPGTGKNFVSKKILENIFKKGDGSRYVTFYRGSIDFPLKSEVHKYKRDLRNEIKEKVYQCHRSVFIFDEVEKMPDGILDVISGFVGAEKEGDYDYRRVIFVLLSNVGSEALNKEVLNAWHNGISREEISSKHLSKILATAAFNSEGGLKHTRLVKNHDVSHFVPFLPLEKRHIIQCLEREVAIRNQIMSPELQELVLDELNFYPEDGGIFATGGCKGVAEKTDLLIEKASWKIRKAKRDLQ